MVHHPYRTHQRLGGAQRGLGFLRQVAEVAAAHHQRRAGVGIGELLRSALGFCVEGIEALRHAHRFRMGEPPLEVVRAPCRQRFRDGIVVIAVFLAAQAPGACVGDGSHVF